ncbi:MAG: hypothetical protein ACWA44_12860 [Thiotrichales bacterium]
MNGNQGAGTGLRQEPLQKVFVAGAMVYGKDADSVEKIALMSKPELFLHIL